MVISEGALFGGHIRKPSALVEYIMFRVNPGLDARFQIEWPGIVGQTPWLAARQHMSQEEFNRFYGEKVPGKLSELEQATEDVCFHTIEELVVKELGTQSVSPSQATPSPQEATGRSTSRPATQISTWSQLD